MKRRISLLLAVVMILGTFSFAFAADVNEKVDLVTKEGILRGDQGTNALRLDDPLARKEAVVLLSRLMDVEEEANNFEKEGLPTFADVQDAVYYKSFIAWAEDNKYFDGNPDGTFGFNDNLTVKQYAAVLLRALGYAEEVYNVEGWKNVEKLANDLNLLEDVETELNDDATREEVAVMTFNALGAKMKDSDKTLAEFLGIEMPVEKPEKLEAKVLDTENLAEVVVELSNADLVKNKDALLNPANYRLSNGVKVQNVHLDGDNVVLTLVPYGKVEEQGKFDSLIKGQRFNLTIRNIDPAINKTYRSILAGDNAIPSVENVDFMGTYGIKVTTSEPIANPLERNFRLDSRTSMKVEQYGRNIILTPYHGKEFDKDAVELTIDRLEDFAGYQSVRTVEKMELSTDEALPKVEAAYRSGNKLVVVFDRDVYHDSIGAYVNRRVLGNASFVERRVTFYAEKAEKVDTNVVEYTFERDIPKGIEVTIEDVANHFNKAMEKESIVPVEYKDEYAPVIISSTANVIAETVDEDKIANTKEMTITFDKFIAEFVPGKDEKEADVVAKLNKDIKDYFTLYELDVTRRGEDAAEGVKIEVTSAKDDTIKLKFKNIKLNNEHKDYDYVLEVRNFSDLSRNRMERDYLDFQVVEASAAFNVEKITVRKGGSFNRDGVEIVLGFNDYVDKESAQDATNYYLDGKLVVNEAIVERDGETVSLVIYDTTVEKLLAKYEVLEISPRVKNLDKDAAVANRFWNLQEDPISPIIDPAVIRGAKRAAEEAIAELPELSKLTLEDKEEVEEARKLVDKALDLGVKEEEITGLATLKEAEAKIKELLKDKEDEKQEEELAKAIDAAKVAIFRLPEEGKLDVTNESHLAAVEEARKLVDKALGLGAEEEDIDNLEELTSLEEKIETKVKDVENLDDLKSAIKDANVEVINIMNDIEVDEKLNITSEKHINGNNNTLTFKDDDEKWQGNYVLQFYETKGSVKDIKLTGGDAAIYVNGSSVTLVGTVDVSGNEFGGIEVSQGEGVTDAPQLTIEGTLLFDGEDIPAIWIDNAELGNLDWVDAEGFEYKYHKTDDDKNQIWFN